MCLLTRQFVPASPDRPDRSNFGVKRLKACLALANRVRKLIDLHGILRKPTVEGVQALVLFSHLQHMTDVDGDTTESLMESGFLGNYLTCRRNAAQHCNLADEGA